MIAIFEEGVGVAIGFAGPEDFQQYIEHLQGLCDQGDRVVVLSKLSEGEQVEQLVRKCEKRLSQVYKVDAATSEGND